MILLSLVVLLTTSCAVKLPGSAFQVRMQEFLEAPVVIECTLTNGKRGKHCTVITTRDYEWMLRELKAACLALNGSREECWVEK